MTVLGHYAFIWRGRILLGAVLLAALAVAGALSVFGVVKPFGFQDPESDSSQSYEVLEQVSGERPLPEVVLAVQPESAVRGPEGRAAVSDAARELRTIPEVTSVRTPETNPELVSEGGKAALVIGYLDASTDDIAAVGETVERRFADQEAVSAGGAAVTSHQLNETTEDDLRRIELIAAPVLFVLLLFVFRGLVAAALPLAVGALSIGGTLGLLWALSHAMEVDLFVINIVTALGLGLAIDYSLFVVSRYREELERHGPTGAALRETMRSTGRMVLFSGLTVAVALAPLAVFPQRFLYSIGVGGALVALCSALVCLTALPAALAVLGTRVNALAPGWLRAKPGGKRWYEFEHSVLNHPVVVVVVVAVAMIVAGLPMLRVELTRADASVLPRESSARQVDRLVQAKFPSDPSSRLVVVVDPRPGNASVLDQAEERLAQHPGIGDVDSVPTGAVSIERRDGELTVAQFSDTAEHAVDLARSLHWGGPNLVGGPSAELADQRESLAEHLPLAIAIIVVATALVLFVMTRSLVLPLVALVMNALTVSVAFGVLVVVFQDGRLEGALDYTSQTALDSSVPILLFALIFGLSTDYGVFLLQRIAEARREGADDREAIALGVARSGRLITAAALLFAVAMGAFAWSDLVFIKEVAVGTAVAVIVDATIVRALLLPAVLRLLGPVAWWGPGRSGRSSQTARV